MTDATWDQKIDRFYEHEFDESDPRGSIKKMQVLASERPEGDAAALFEMGGVHDSLGLEGEAIRLYRDAIAAGLEGERATRVYIQLASTLRNVGASAEAVSMLESMPAAGADEAPRQAFLALALYDEGRYGDALRTALNALIPTLHGYRRSLAGYAEDLPRAVKPKESVVKGRLT
ncbi:tetratricopeptide repeat protein [Arthrobacter halodurans]|uniref:Tetratricopeptide repeat protein n=1 Tax=Arthrobacter halodurans TaxID=516699 RepID=A0ABV4ULL4_9MICC